MFASCGWKWECGFVTSANAFGHEDVSFLFCGNTLVGRVQGSLLEPEPGSCGIRSQEEWKINSKLLKNISYCGLISGHPERKTGRRSDLFLPPPPPAFPAGLLKGRRSLTVGAGRGSSLSAVPRSLGEARVQGRPGALLSGNVAAFAERSRRGPSGADSGCWTPPLPYGAEPQALLQTQTESWATSSFQLG